MKRTTLIISMLLLSLLFMADSCDSASTQEIKGYMIGDKFTHQSDVDIARADKDVIVYRLYTLRRYHYYSTTRKDSIIYRIHSNVNK